MFQLFIVLCWVNKYTINQSGDDIKTAPSTPTCYRAPPTGYAEREQIDTATMGGATRRDGVTKTEKKNIYNLVALSRRSLVKTLVHLVC